MGKIPSCGTLSKFYMDSMIRANRTGERYGQAIINHLSVVRPGLASLVHRTNLDVSDMQGPADNFAVLIETNWYC